VIGGTTYRKEVKKLGKSLEFLAELRRAGKLSIINDAVVDKEKDLVSALETHPDFDDQHIVALFRVSGCRVFASHDKRADRFVKKKALYRKGQKPPSIYRNYRHNNLLIDTNIVQLNNLQKMKYFDMR
jgi:predicted nucleic acid-binding protein